MIEYSPFSTQCSPKMYCKLSTFKYYNRIHQKYNGKVSLKLNLTSHFQTYLLFIFVVPKFFKFGITSL
jgi:hypothetical protein